MTRAIRALFTAIVLRGQCQSQTVTLMQAILALETRLLHVRLVRSKPRQAMSLVTPVFLASFKRRRHQSRVRYACRGRHRYLDGKVIVVF